MIRFFKTINYLGFQDPNVELKRLVAEPVK